MARHSPDLNIMIKAAEKAGRSLVRDFGEVENLQVSQKGPGDFVSAADHRAEEIIHRELERARPGWSFLMEESGMIEGADKEHRWIVDPLDGTTNFLHGLPHWCISIALEKKGEITAGIIYDPVKDQMFMAEKGKGAFEKRQRLRVSGRRNIASALILTGEPWRNLKKGGERFLKEYTAVQNLGCGSRRFGAAALDLAYVAAGRCEGFWERDLSAWDIAAGIILIKEAGGFVSDLDDPKTKVMESGNIIAANTYIFDDLFKTLKAVS